MTPKILSVPFDPQDNAFLSWAHPYAAFHNWSNCWVCGALPSSSVKGFLWWTSPLQVKVFLQVCKYLYNNHMGCLFFIWWHLTILKWTGVTVRTGHGTTDWFQIGKRVHQGCILSPCLFKLYTEYIVRNTGLEEAQAGIKIARRNVNNFR